MHFVIRSASLWERGIENAEVIQLKYNFILKFINSINSGLLRL